MQLGADIYPSSKAITVLTSEVLSLLQQMLFSSSELDGEFKITFLSPLLYGSFSRGQFEKSSIVQADQYPVFTINTADVLCTSIASSSRSSCLLQISSRDASDMSGGAGGPDRFCLHVYHLPTSLIYLSTFGS